MSDRERFFYSIFLALTVGIAVFCRLPFLCMERMWPDEALYAWNAQRIFEDPGMIFSKEVTDFHPPLFSVLLSFGHLFWPGWEACRIVVFLLNILGIIAIYILGRRISGEFLGCYSAIVLSFNLQYFNMSNFILSDGAIAVGIIFIFWALTHIHSHKIDSKDFAFGLVVVGFLMLKWSAVLLLPFLCVYYPAAYTECAFSRRFKKGAVPLVMASLLIVVLLWHNHNILGSWIPQVFNARNDSYRQPFFFYLQHFYPLVFAYALVPFLALGLCAASLGQNRDAKAQAMWVAFGLFSLSAMPAKDFRFLLIVIPGMIVVSGIGLESLLLLGDKKPFLKRLLRPAVLLIILCYMGFVHFKDVRENVIRKSYTFTGYPEAGYFIRESSRRNPAELILASSPRMVRYFSNVNFKEFGGRLQAFPRTQAEFLRLVNETHVDMILAVDRWELSQPGWLFPPTQANNQFLKDLGFKLETKIMRDVQMSAQSLEKMAVIWIFRRPGQLK